MKDKKKSLGDWLAEGPKNSKGGKLTVKAYNDFFESIFAATKRKGPPQLIWTGTEEGLEKFMHAIAALPPVPTSQDKKKGRG